MSNPTDEVLSLMNEVSFSLNLLGASPDSVYYEDLPDAVRSGVDKIAREILDPEGGQAMVLGFSSSGKSFLIEQFAGNVDRYLPQSTLDNLQLISVSRADANRIETIPNGITQYIKACSKSLMVKQENICLVTESPDFAAAVYSYSKDIKVILELNLSTHETLTNRESAGASKIWSSWGEVNANEIFLTREELVESLALVMIPKLDKGYGVVLEDNEIDHMLEHALEQIPSILFAPEAENDEEAEEIESYEAYGKIIIPPGFWGLALRKLGSAIAYSSNKNLLNKSGEKDLCLHVDMVIGELGEDLVKMLGSFADPAQDLFQMTGGSFPFPVPEGANISFLSIGHMLDSDDDESEKEYDETPLVFSDIDTLEDRLKTTVIGQDSAITTVVDAMAVPAAGINDQTKPVRSFMFLGPTGVGKTQLALSIAAQVASEPMNVIRLDMSEYSQPHEASKLLGSPSGYVGHEEGGVLTNAVFENPRSLILLDEVEKAHYKIWDSFLQIFDAGRMTDNKGREVDFTRCIIVMTSNLGSKESNKNGGLGFNGVDGGQEKVKQNMNREIESFFRPEFINRIDDFVFFNQLSIETAREIVKREISLVSDRMKPSGFKLSPFDDGVIDEIIKLSSFNKYGARDIQRAVFKNVSQPLAKRMLSKTKKRKSIKISLAGDNKIQVS